METKFYTISVKWVLEIGSKEDFFYADLIDLDMHKKISTTVAESMEKLLLKITVKGYFSINNELIEGLDRMIATILNDNTFLY